MAVHTDIKVSPETHPLLCGKEAAFFDFWLDRVVDPSDPHLQRWVDYEEGAADRAAARTRSLEEVEPVAGADVLEIGCQNGAWLVSLAQSGARPTGIDVVASSIEAATCRASCWGVEVDARVGDACNLEFESESFDIVATSDVIEHVPDKEAMVRECMRVLRPQGLLMISAPQRFSVKHFRADPHYQYAGVSVLPASVVSWYLTTFRGEPVYEVETLPTGHQIRRLIRRHGGQIIESPPSPNAAAAWVSKLPRPARAAIDELRQGFVIFARKRG